MADVTDFDVGARFTVRVRSSLTSNHRVRWFNTYEFRSNISGGVSELNSLAGIVGDFHEAISYNYITIDQVQVSTWEADSHPYNPLGFFTRPINQVGDLPLGVKTPVSLRQTMFVKRGVSSGLPGKLFYRGALSNEDLAYADGEWVLADIIGLNTDLQAATVSTSFSEYLGGVAGSPEFYLCLIGDGGETRAVTRLDVDGTSDVKLNHKYFDRTP